MRDDMEAIMNIPNQLRLIAESSWFQTFIILVIVAAGILVGVQTYDRPGFVVHEWTDRLNQIDNVILWIFVAEIATQMSLWHRCKGFSRSSAS